MVLQYTHLVNVHEHMIPLGTVKTFGSNTTIPIHPEQNIAYAITGYGYSHPSINFSQTCNITPDHTAQTSCPWHYVVPLTLPSTLSFLLPIPENALLVTIRQCTMSECI